MTEYLQPFMLIMVGLPGSGKTNYAMDLINKEPEYDWARINWDEMRAAIPGWSFSRAAEDAMQQRSFEQARQWIQAGRSVVIDDTNLSTRTRMRWRALGEALGARVLEHYMPTSHYDCVIRDAQRSGSSQVGQAVIDRMALFHGLIEWEPGRKIVIFDMDGTLSTENRLPYIKQRPKNWDKFFENVENDPPIPTVVEWVQAIANETNHYIVIVSGRPIDRAGKGTVKWLQNNHVPFDYIFMRQSKDYKDDTIIKKEILDKMPKDMIEFAVDDRKRICDMWRANGIRVFNVSPDGVGDF